MYLETFEHRALDFTKIVRQNNQKHRDIRTVQTTVNQE